MTQRVRGSSAVEDLFSPITPGRISRMIVDQVRSLIREGRLAPGDRLPSERELAEQFAVSRVTVRDALRALEATGLVEIKVGANGGAFLRAPSSAIAGQGMSDMLLMSELSVEEIAEARLMLEQNTVLLAVRRAKEADIAELRAICEQQAQLLSGGEYDVRLSWDFHDRLARATHNPAIEMITKSFRGPLSMGPVRALEPASLAHERTVSEHTEIVDAIERRDVEAARLAMAAHLVRATNLEERLGGLDIPGIVASMPSGDLAKESWAGRANGDGESPEEGSPVEEPSEEGPLSTGVDPADPLKREEEESPPGVDPVVDPIPPG